jgi:hypothetical protein
MLLQNSQQVLNAENIGTLRQILREYLKWGFVEIVTEMPYCILPLQLKISSSKVALIYDMSPLNVYVEKSKFKLESWEEMVEYAITAEYAIKFDIKKFYHGLSINVNERKFFGFMFPLEENKDPCMFVWKTMPYGYTRAPFLARNLMKPLIAKWRNLNTKIVVFYDDGMAVHENFGELKKISLQIQADLINAGLIPGVNKCVWTPVQKVDWNGLEFDLKEKTLKILDHRILATLKTATDLKDS